MFCYCFELSVADMNEYVGVGEIGVEQLKLPLAIFM